MMEEQGNPTKPSDRHFGMSFEVLVRHLVMSTVVQCRHFVMSFEVPVRHLVMSTVVQYRHFVMLIDLED
jgi:uncharacterized Fe-S radical SAM superfamily protein PflX